MARPDEKYKLAAGFTETEHRIGIDPNPGTNGRAGQAIITELFQIGEGNQGLRVLGDTVEFSFYTQENNDPVALRDKAAEVLAQHELPYEVIEEVKNLSDGSRLFDSPEPGK